MTPIQSPFCPQWHKDGAKATKEECFNTHGPQLQRKKPISLCKQPAQGSVGQVLLGEGGTGVTGTLWTWARTHSQKDRPCAFSSISHTHILEPTGFFK